MTAPEARMTSCVDRLFRRALFAGLAFALAVLLAADGASAQAPPAAVDQYKPAPPGITDPDPGRPDRPGDGDGAGDGGAATPGTGAVGGAGTPTSGPAGAGGTSSGSDGGAGSASGGGGTEESGTGARSGSGSNADGSGGTGPVVGGYPLTSTLTALIVAIVIGLCAAGGVAMWRRRRAGALAGSS